MLSGEATNTKFIVFGLNRHQPTIYHTQSEHANHYTKDVVRNNVESCGQHIGLTLITWWSHQNTGLNELCNCSLQNKNKFYIVKIDFIFNTLKFYKHRHWSLDINIKFMNLLKDNKSGRNKRSRTKLSNIKPWIYHTKIKMHQSLYYKTVECSELNICCWRNIAENRF